MAKIKKLKLGQDTIYPATVPQAIEDPNTKEKLSDTLPKLAEHGYEENPKTLKEVDDEKADHGYDTDETPRTLKQVDYDAVMRLNNLNPNGNFANGIVGWLFGSNISGASASSGVLSFTGGGVLSSSANNWVRRTSQISFPQGHVLYNIVTARSLMGASFYVGIGYSFSDFDLTDQWGTYSHLGSHPTHNVPTYGAILGDTAEMTNAMCFDLTEIFGAGNEPTKEEMDLLISILGIDFFEGEITIPAQKIMQWQLKLRTQLESDVNLFKEESNLKDAIQDSKIKDIESIISTMNPNQSAQLSVTGVSPLSLPKNAANGGMQVKLEGLTAENLVVNGDFRNGMTGWTLRGNHSTSTVIDGILNIVATGSGNDSGGGDIYRNIPRVSGNKYYTTFMYKNNGGDTCRLNVYTPAGKKIYTISDAYQKYSDVVTSEYTSSIPLHIYATEVTSGANILFDNFMVINLTETFGAGNEPTVEECEAMFSDYFEGVKSFEPTGRVRSVGKNLINESKSYMLQLYAEPLWIDGKIRFYTNNYLRSSAFWKVYLENGKTYRLSKANEVIVSGSGVVNANIADDNNITIRGNMLGISFLWNAPSGIYYVRPFTNAGNVTVQDSSCNIQLERSSLATPYEPYKETNLYLTAPELRSNGTVKDEIRKGSNGYELVKRVGVGTLGNNLVTNGTFDTATGWTVGGESTISNGSARIYTPDGSNSYIMVPSITLSSTKAYKVIFDVLDSNGESLNLSSSGIISTPTPIGTGISKLFVGNDGRLTFKRLVAGLTDVTIDNVKLHEVLLQDGAISNTSTFTELSDGTILYTLATPEIIPISYGGVLNSAENGTVYHEPIIADAGVYDTKMDILLTEYPIASIVEIIKHENGIDTYLNVASAVVASDGLSFTHPDLADGDLVLFTYAFDKESTNGNITATFYDSNVVKIDTVTGKAYKIEDVVTNGVLTRTLTEV